MHKSRTENITGEQDKRRIHPGGGATGCGSAKDAFIGVQIHFNSWNSSAIKNLPSFHFGDYGGNGFLHVIGDEEHRIGCFCPNSGINGVFYFPGEHVLVQIFLHRHFLQFTIKSSFLLLKRELRIRARRMNLGKISVIFRF